MRILAPPVLASILGSLPVSFIGAQSEAVLRPADTGPGLLFGTAVSLSGTGLLVGAPGLPGRAYVFRLTPAGWVEEATFAGPGAGGFGLAVSLVGDLAFVGAQGAVGPSGHASGLVFMFERTAAGWGAPSPLEPSDAATTTSFGHDIAAGAERVLVAGKNQAYVFEPIAGTWTETAILAGETGPLRDVDLHGRRAVLAHNAAFVFEHGGSSWDSGTKLDTSGAQPTSSGLLVALDHDRVAAIGSALPCFFGDINGYEWWASEWRKSSLLFGFNQIAHSAEMDGGRLALAGSNVLSIFRTLPSGGWVLEEAHVAALAAGTFELAGGSISGGLGALGSPFDDTGGTNSGSVSIFELAPLVGLPESVSVVSGGAQQLELRRGPLEASSLYWIFGSATGTSPGMMVDGLPLPLNFDGYYLFLALHPNTLVDPTIGILDADGRSTAEIAFAALDPALAGITLHHVYLTFDLTGEPFVNFVSNPVPLRFSTETPLPPEDFEAGAIGWELGSDSFGLSSWQIVEDGVCGAVTRMAAFTTPAPACGGDEGTAPISGPRLVSSAFRLGQPGDYELRLDSRMTPGLGGRIRLFVEDPPSAYFEVAWPFDFADTGELEHLSFHVPGIEYAIGRQARLEFLLNGAFGGTPTGWWIDNVELVELP